MKKISTILLVVVAMSSARAQSSGNFTDSASHHHPGRQWGKDGRQDSAARGSFDRFRHDRGTAMTESNSYGINKFHGGRNWHHRYGENRIHFSADQRKQMQEMNTDYRKKSADLYKQDNLTLKEYKARLLALQKEKKNKMRQLLTPEQKNQMEVFKKYAEENAQVRAAARLERMKIRLQLTEDQATAIRSKQQSMRLDMRTIRENDNLMADQKMEQVKALAKRNSEEIASILTPAQFAEFENMHKHRDGQ